MSDSESDEYEMVRGPEWSQPKKHVRVRPQTSIATHLRMPAELLGKPTRNPRTMGLGYGKPRNLLARTAAPTFRGDIMVERMTDITFEKAKKKGSKSEFSTEVESLIKGSTMEELHRPNPKGLSLPS